MYTISLIDWIMTTALIAASWQLYQVMQPRTPTADADRSHAPSASAEPIKTIVDSKPLDEMLQQIGRTGSFRSLDDFMQGAKLAYEAVVTAFAAGEIAPIAGWLGPAVRKALDDAVAERVARQETLRPPSSASSRRSRSRPGSTADRPGSMHGSCATGVGDHRPRGSDRRRAPAPHRRGGRDLDLARETRSADPN